MTWLLPKKVNMTATGRQYIKRDVQQELVTEYYVKRLENFETIKRNTFIALLVCNIFH